MNDIVIALDFDDVLFPFNTEFPKWHNERFGTSIEYEGIYTFNMPVLYQVPRQVIFERVQEFYQSAEHFAAKPLPGVEAFLRMLRMNKRVGVEVVTARPESSRAISELWLETRLPQQIDCINFTNQFSVEDVIEQRTKRQLCQEIGAFVLVEDSINHAIDVAMEGITVLMPDRPWNQSAMLPPQIVRCPTYIEVLAAIEALLEQ